MKTPYRVAAVREEGPRPLEPEEEMRLLLRRGSWPRGAQAIAQVVIAIVLVASTAMGVWLRETSVLLMSLYVASFLFAGLLVSMLRYRLDLRALRAKGYDVTAVTGAQMRFPPEARVRVEVDRAEPMADTLPVVEEAPTSSRRSSTVMRARASRAESGLH